MSRSGAGKDQAGREFEALLAALPRKRPAAPLRAVPRASRAPVGDSEFENLLNEFRSLSNPSSPASAIKASSVSPSQSPDSIQPVLLPGQESLVQALDALGRERDRLRARLDTVHDELALKAIDGLNRQITHLQVSLMHDFPDKFLLLRDGGQHYALVLGEVVRVCWRGEEERDSKKGVRHGTGWVPVHAVSPRQSGQGLAGSAPGEDVIAIIAVAGNVLAISADSVEGVVSAALTPLNTVLQGAQGLKGVAVTETGLHALVLDANRLGRGS